MNTPHLWLAACMLMLASSLNTIQSQTYEAASAPVLTQLDFPLSLNTLALLKAEGIELLHHYGNGAYLVSAAPSGFQKLEANNIGHVEPTVLHTLDQTTHAIPTSRVDVDLVLAFEQAPSFLAHVLAKADFRANARQFENGRTLNGSIPIDKLQELLLHPYVLDATPSLRAVEPYNFKARIAQSVTPLNSGIAGAPNLNGSGIVIGVGDGGALGGHPDMGARVVHSTESYNAGWGSHPDMVSGIIAGSGNVFSANRGVAAEAELVIESSTGIVYFAPSYLEDFGMTITNNSYGPSFHCNTANRYYGNSASTDQQLYDNPSLLHVFAVGNSGRASCTASPEGYSTIPGGPQNAKNTLSVGNVDFNRVRYETSSVGPTLDGRLKPEIATVGTTVTTTIRNGGYGSGTGTSFAAPNVASTLALLSEAFQVKNPGIIPDGALLKAIACNSADDAGREGPDFEYGFGILNAHNALQVVETGQYESGTITSTGQLAHTISIEDQAPELKVMLYWNDVAGSTSNQGPALVEDLDLLLITPDGTVIKPLILDPTNPTSLAVEGEDHLNNIEQVTLKNPAPGDYTVVVRSSNLTYGECNYVVTWQAPVADVMLTCPYGGESIVPGQTTYIGWSATTSNIGTWSVEYRSMNSDWQIIEANIPADQRSITWAAPSNTNQVELRITNAEAQVSDVTNLPVSIVAPPSNLASSELCATALQLNWKPANGAISYNVYRFDGEEMLQIGSTTDTAWTFEELGMGEELLISVSSVTENGLVSKRAFAHEVTHSGLEDACNVSSLVEWGDFSTEELGSAVRLHWDVIQEQRIQRFEVERGLVANQVMGWTFVDSVDAKGNSTTTLSYELDDPGAVAEGSTFYRVRMIGQDGLDTYSEEIVHHRTSNTTSATNEESSTVLLNETSEFTLLQNPVDEVLRIYSKKSIAQRLDLYDALGRKQGNLELSPGINEVPWPSDLGAGLYLLKVADLSQSRAIKLIRR